MTEETSEMKEEITESVQDKEASASENAVSETPESSGVSETEASGAEEGTGADAGATEDSEGADPDGNGEEGKDAEPEEKGQWYVVHTYSGYENKVRINLNKAIQNNHMEDQIFEIRVPMQDVVELRDGVRKTVSKKMFPGYVLIRMIMNEDTWYVARNTRGVTGFVGPGSKPSPLSDAEMKAMGYQTSGTISVDFAEGDTISVVAGVWKDTIGVVQRMDYSKQTATINVEIFGRDTPVEISFAEVKSMK